MIYIYPRLMHRYNAAMPNENQQWRRINWISGHTDICDSVSKTKVKKFVRKIDVLLCVRSIGSQYGHYHQLFAHHKLIDTGQIGRWKMIHHGPDHRLIDDAN